MKRVLLVLLIAVLAVPFFALSTPAQAASGIGVYTAGCTVFVEFDGSGLYRLETWDDGAIIDVREVVGDGHIVIGADLSGKTIGTAAPGIGLSLYENGAWIWGYDPYDFTACIDACEANIPAGSVVGELLEPTVTYWAPGEAYPVTPQFILIPLPENKTWWVLGMDSTHSWYQILVSCQKLWVPAGAMGPNYDKVWNGTPLPTRVVS